MNIEIDQNAIAKLMSEQLTGAVKSAASDYSTKAGLAKLVGEALTGHVMEAAVRSAVSLVDVPVMTTMIAEELQRSTAIAVSAVVREAMVDVLMRLRGVSTYPEQTYQAHRARALAELGDTSSARILELQTEVERLTEKLRCRELEEPVVVPAREEPF